MRLKRYQKIILYSVFFVSLSWVCLLCFSGSIYDYQDTFSLHPPLPPLNVILVLGGGKGRITTGLKLWYQYWTQFKGKKDPPLLYFAGLGSHITLSQLLLQTPEPLSSILTSEGVIIETKSYNTITNAQCFMRTAQEKKWTKAVLITSSYHMKRAHKIFQAMALKASFPLIHFETLSVSSPTILQSKWRTQAFTFKITVLEWIKTMSLFFYFF